MKSVTVPMYAGDCLSRNIAESSVSAYLLSCLVKNPMMVRKSQRMRVPRSEAPQRSAISVAVVLPSPMAVNSSSSTAVLIAGALIVLLHVEISNRVSLALEFVVGLMLILLGANALRKLL